MSFKNTSLRENYKRLKDPSGFLKESITESNTEKFKVGDYIRKEYPFYKSGGVTQVEKGFVWWVHPTGNFVKLEDQYGNRSDKLRDVSGFKLISNPPERVKF